MAWLRGLVKLRQLLAPLPDDLQVHRLALVLDGLQDPLAHALPGAGQLLDRLRQGPAGQCVGPLNGAPLNGVLYNRRTIKWRTI